MGRNLRRNRVAALSASPEGKWVNFTWRLVDGTTLPKGSRPRDVGTLAAQRTQHCWAAFPKTHNLHLIMRKHWTKLRDILPQLLTSALQKYKVVTDEGRLRNGPSPEKPEETWQLNGPWSPQWGPGAEKGHAWDNQWNPNKIHGLVNTIPPCFLLSLKHSSAVTLAFRKVGERYASTLNTLSLYNISESLKLFQNKKKKHLYLCPLKLTAQQVSARKGESDCKKIQTDKKKQADTTLQSSFRTK